ncbi:MAG: DUF4239 domain-containing protein [Armatimonadota bacterium]
MTNYAIAVSSCVLLAFVMVACTVWGHRIGRRRYQQDAVGEELPTAVFDAAVMSLLGLLIAFTFANAYSRFEKRRDLIVQEYNAIGTAYARLQLLPLEQQAALRHKFREYVNTRYQLWMLRPNQNAAMADFKRSEELEKEIWADAVDATKNDTADARKLLLPALNDMISFTTTREIMTQSHPPLLVFGLLFFLSLVAAWTIGFGMGNCIKPSYLHAIGFATVVALALYVIFEIEYPRYGIVTLDAPHELLKQLGEEMK